MTKQIYFYSDPARYEDQIALGKTPMLKIGDTTQQTTDERIKQQDTTACAQLLEKKGSYFTPFGDKEFHKHLESLGYKKTRAEREWFYITIEDAERELIDYRDGVVKVQKYFNPRSLCIHEMKVGFEPRNDTHRTFKCCQGFRFTDPR
mgnify:CR=1 FL=1